MAEAMVNVASVAYTESYVVEDDIVTQARDRGRELGCVPIGPGGGAALRVLAAAAQTRSVIRIGTGAVVSWLYLLGEMATDGVLTTIDVECKNQLAAKEA